MYCRCRSRRYLARNLIEDNRDKFIGEFEVGGLEDVTRTVEDYEGIT